MKANASPALTRKIANAPHISFEMPHDAIEHCGNYVQPTFTIRYAIRSFMDCGREVYDVEVLDVELESAVAWIGDTGVNVPCGDKNFEVSAVALFENWHGYYSAACRCWPNRDLIDAKCVADYEGSQD